MPWKRKSMGGRKLRLLFLALAAAVAAGVLAGLAGTMLDKRGAAALDKYSAYKALIGNRSPGEIKAALEKRGISVP